MAYDIMSGFNVGQAIGGQSSLGEFVRQITQRAQSIQELRLQAQAGGLAEEEKMKGLGRFFQSPEGQSYLQSFTGGSFPGTQADSQATLPAQSQQPQVSQNASVNDYIGQLASQREQPVTPKYRARFSFGMQGPQRSLEQTEFGMQSPAPSDRDAIKSIENRVANAESILNLIDQHPGQLSTGRLVLTDPANPLVRAAYAHFNPVENELLTRDRANFLPFRVSAEGLRFVQGGVSYAQTAVPDPSTDPLPLYQRKVKSFIAAALAERERLLGTMHQSGIITDEFPPMSSPHTNDLSANEFFNFHNQHITFGDKFPTNPFQPSGELSAPLPVSRGQYRMGQTISLPNGKQARVVGFYPDGEPDVEVIR